MGKATGFIEYERSPYGYEKVEKRKKTFAEFIIPQKKSELTHQTARCMDCGIPFCSNSCPLGNIIPDFNDYIYRGNEKAAFDSLISTNNFPDITGRVCPAPCESGCVLGINKPPVTIKSIEYAISEMGHKNNWFDDGKKAQKQVQKPTGKRVAIIGSGPAGLACADQLSTAGHAVTVYERDDEIGGLLTYGIPNFKLEKPVVFRHVKRMEKKGVKFISNCWVGRDKSIKEIKKESDAIVLAIGATVPRDLKISNRAANGIHYAMDFLTQNTKRVLKKKINEPLIDAKGKHVVVIGGGDTGSDCIGTSIRQGAKSVNQIEILPKPPLKRDETMPWPDYDHIFRVSTSQEEGCTRKFSILTEQFLVDAEGKLAGIEYEEIVWDKNKGFEKTGKKGKIKADLVFLAMGFLSPEQDLIKQLKLEVDERNNIKSDASKTERLKYFTNVKGVFSAGDSRRGQSLVVWAISEGRECAIAVDEYLTKKPSKLPSKIS